MLNKDISDVFLYNFREPCKYKFRDCHVSFKCSSELDGYEFLWLLLLYLYNEL